MGITNWLGFSTPGDKMSASDSETEDRIQAALDQLVKGPKAFGNRTMDAGQAEKILRQQGILPEGWRLRNSDSTSSGYRPTRAASLKKAALHAGILGGATATGLGAAGIGPLSGVFGAGASSGLVPGATAEETAAALGSGAGIGGGTAAGLGTGAGVGIGETASSYGLASGAGLPGATAIGAGAAPTTVGATMGLVPGSTAAETASALGSGGGVSSYFKSFLSPGNLISLGANGIGSYLSSRAAGKAADQQAAAAEKALQLQKDVYNQTRSDLMPWMEQGRGASITLGRLMGVPGMAAPGITPNTSMPTPPASTPDPTGGRRPPGVGTPVGPAVPRDPMAGRRPDGMGMPISPGQPRMVRLQAPDGSWGNVPEDQVAAVQAKFAQAGRAA